MSARPAVALFVALLVLALAAAPALGTHACRSYAEGAVTTCEHRVDALGVALPFYVHVHAAEAPHAGVMALVDVEASHAFPRGSGDVKVHGYVVANNTFLQPFLRVRWVDDSGDGIPEGVTVQGPFALVVPLAP